jgi:hypothetical protein
MAATLQTGIKQAAINSRRDGHCTQGGGYFKCSLEEKIK